jgi:hypothetical protein
MPDVGPADIGPADFDSADSQAGPVGIGPADSVSASGIMTTWRESVHTGMYRYILVHPGMYASSHVLGHTSMYHHVLFSKVCTSTY